MKIKYLDKFCPKCNKWAMKWKNNEFVCGNCGCEEKIGHAGTSDVRYCRLPLMYRHPCLVVDGFGKEVKATFLGWVFGYSPFETEESIKGVVKFESDKILVLEPESIRLFNSDVEKYYRFLNEGGGSEDVADR